MLGNAKAIPRTSSRIGTVRLAQRSRPLTKNTQILSEVGPSGLRRRRIRFPKIACLILRWVHKIGLQLDAVHWLRHEKVY